MHSMVKVAVAGASGYAGGELIRLLHQHPEFEMVAITAESQTGQLLSSVHPNLAGLGRHLLQPTTPDVLAEADLVFLALPHGASASIAHSLPVGTQIVDLGADHRLGNADAWSQYYPGGWAGSWTYGMPELPGLRERIAESSRVANPGCYPTGVILGLYPLLAAGLVSPQDVVIVAASGTSGAGKKPAGSLMASEVAGSIAAYKVGGSHQHTPEIEQALSWAAQEPATISFTPLLAPMPRGITAVSTAKLLDHAITTELVSEVLHDAYQHEAFVHIATDTWPASGWTVGGNGVALRATVDAHAGRVIVVSAIDNLGKGAAGQALQNANIMCGFPETYGLTNLGVAP